MTKVTRKQIHAAIRRVGKHLGMSGPRFKWHVRSGFETPEDDYPFSDGSEASHLRGDHDGGWGGFRRDRSDLMKNVKMGRGADCYVYYREEWDSYSKEWIWELKGSFEFTLPETPEGNIVIEPILDWDVAVKEIPFSEKS